MSVYHDLRLTAECSNRANGKCVLTRTMRPPIHRSNRVQGRNLGELVAWLAAGRDTTTVPLKAHGISPPREQRSGARQYLKDPLAMRVRAGRLCVRGRRGAVLLSRNRKIAAVIFDTGNGVRKSPPKNRHRNRLADSQTDNNNNTRGL